MLQKRNGKNISTNKNNHGNASYLHWIKDDKILKKKIVSNLKMDLNKINNKIFNKDNSIRLL